MAKTLSLQPQMSRSFLIQRLNKPVGFVNPFSFGGGLVNGGLSEKASDMLSEIFSFDYMGAAEFEWGAVPAALQFVAEQASAGKLVSGQHQGVYYIAPLAYEEGVKRVIDQLINNEYDLRLKERCGLATALNRQSAETRGPVGWLELDNGFFMFVDQEMFENTKRVFGIE